MKYGVRQVKDKLNRIKSHLRYNRYAVVLMIGLSCASFAHLSGGDSVTSIITFFLVTIAMFVRQSLAHRHYNPLIVFSVTAFVATLIAGIAWKYQLGNDPQIYAGIQRLIVGSRISVDQFLSGYFKGHINMGLSRWTIATVLTFGACLGIVLALSLLNITGWGELNVSVIFCH